jgi:hypothetical protein
MDVSRREFMRRFGIGSGAVLLLKGGGRALSSPAAMRHAVELDSSGIPVTTDAANLSHFGFMFPGLKPFGSGFPASQVMADIQVLAASSLTAPVNSPATPLVEPGGVNDSQHGAWFTYFGQAALVHDVTLDPTVEPDSPVDPATIPNYEEMFLNMSSMYGGGPAVSPQLFGADGRSLLTRPNVNGAADLPRNPDGSAIIVELRDDEQQITSQVLYALQQFHNYVAGLFSGQTFEQVSETVRQYIQWVVLTDWMPRLVGQDTINGLLGGSIPRFYNPGSVEQPMTPVEYSVGAMRLHSMIRNAYALQATTNGLPSFPNNRLTLFNGPDGSTGTTDLHGGRPLAADHVIDWSMFVNQLTNPVNGFDPAGGDSFLQVFKQIIPQFGASTFLLPIGGQSGAAPQGSQRLINRDMIRSYFYGMPSGQAVAEAMGIPAISGADILNGLPTPVNPSLVPSFAAATPLPLYCLAETYLTQSAPGGLLGYSAYLVPNVNGTFTPDHLGPVSARIIGDVLLNLMTIEHTGILNPGVNFTPAPPIAPKTGQFQFADLLVRAGVAKYPSSS